MGSLLTDILTGIGSGVSSLLITLIQALTEGFGYLIYVDPTAETKEYNTVTAWIVAMFAIWLVFWVIKKIMGLFSFGRAKGSA